MNQPLRPSPFVSPDAPRLDPAKFRDPLVTARGEARARVGVKALTTLWFNTGTLCNLTCLNCYIESSPTNDALSYLTAAEARAYLDEIAQLGLPVREIGFTGGEPFMNPDILSMIGEALARGFEVLVLTNAMKPMELRRAGLLALKSPKLTIRVSLDHHTAAVHEAERGVGTWEKTLEGLRWLAREGFSLAVAGRRLTQESEAEARAGYAALFGRLGMAADIPLVLFPEMDATCDVPEITTACWGILNKSPDDLMCASSRMVVKRRGAERPVITACTLTPYDPQFELGSSLAQALGEIPLNHPHCAKFCVLGGASCSAP
ncbi:MAG TPA: radical SAM protein [Caulobacteraceae bacterium]